MSLATGTVTVARALMEVGLPALFKLAGGPRPSLATSPSSLSTLCSSRSWPLSTFTSSVSSRRTLPATSPSSRSRIPPLSSTSPPSSSVAGPSFTGSIGMLGACGPQSVTWPGRLRIEATSTEPADIPDPRSRIESSRSDLGPCGAPWYRALAWWGAASKAASGDVSGLTGLIREESLLVSSRRSSSLRQLRIGADMECSSHFRISPARPRCRKSRSSVRTMRSNVAALSPPNASQSLPFCVRSSQSSSDTRTPFPIRSVLSASVTPKCVKLPRASKSRASKRSRMRCERLSSDSKSVSVLRIGSSAEEVTGLKAGIRALRIRSLSFAITSVNLSSNTATTTGSSVQTTTMM
mmetsp:Transcript_3406/g.7008  ORF Transcript_3406/g.7008 Transcript_3406/m.7008 type:complete len:352 (-) Transcript_3406:402-1457(-)